MYEFYNRHYNIIN